MFTKNEHTGAQWTWNGSHDKPTFDPSILVRYESRPADRPQCCHSVVKDGVIHFCDDSTHELAGKQVPLEPF